MVTPLPDVALMGENEVIIGIPAAATMKFFVLVVSPLGASTAIVPDVAPLGTAVVIIVSDTTVNVGWFVPLNRTAVASPLLLNPLPMMVTAFVATPHAGVNEEIVAAEAGSAVTTIPIAPTTNATAVARAETLFCFWCLNIVPPSLAAARSDCASRRDHRYPFRGLESPVTSSIRFPASKIHGLRTHGVHAGDGPRSGGVGGISAFEAERGFERAVILGADEAGEARIRDVVVLERDSDRAGDPDGRARPETRQVERHALRSALPLS
jgi:hypothetical protein